MVAAIVLWNTVYLEQAVAAIRQSGQSECDETLAYLSPLKWEHINLTGYYHWRKDAGLQNGKLRPLWSCLATARLRAPRPRQKEPPRTESGSGAVGPVSPPLLHLFESQPIVRITSITYTNSPKSPCSNEPVREFYVTRTDRIPIQTAR